MLHPDQAFAMMATKSLLVPTASATPSVAPIPTVVPDKPIFEHVHHGGKITLWIVFAIMLVSTLSFIGMAWRIPVQKRLFHVITTFITLVATISYFAMATGDGNSFAHIVVKSVHNHTPDTFQHIFRQIFWARYIDWTLTTPLLLLDLAFIAGLNGADIITSIVADVVMILTGMFAAYGRHGTQKWGYFAIAIAAYLAIIWQFIVGGRRAVKSKSAATGKFFAALAGFTFIVWTLYPVVWALGDGSRLLSVDAEIIAYAVLDVLAKPVFGFWLLITHARDDSGSVEGFWSHGLSNEGTLRLDDDEGA